MKRTLSTADVARLIRKDLKNAFRFTKFYVRSRSFAGGSAIDVKWIDGPTRSSVNRLIGKYESTNFDGTIDMTYHIDHYRLPDGSVHVHKTTGTTGSMGIREGFANPLPFGAEPVSLGTGYLSTDREYSFAYLAPYVERFNRTHGVRVTLKTKEIWINGKPQNTVGGYIDASYDDERTWFFWLKEEEEKDASSDATPDPALDATPTVETPRIVPSAATGAVAKARWARQGD